MNDRTLRISLWLAFVFNFVAAVTLARPASWLGQQLDLPAGVSPIYSLVAAYFVALFGVTYAWLARQSVIDRPLLGLSSVGKFGAFAITIGLWLADEVSLLVVIVTIGDLAFAALWFVWLRSANRRVQTRSPAGG